MKILIAPTLYIKTSIHIDWFKRSIESLRDSDIDFDLVGFVNHLEPCFDGIVCPKFKELIQNDHNNLSDSWNKAIQYGIDNGYDYTIIPNLDIQVRPDTVSKLIEFAEKEGGVMWSPYCTNRNYDLKPNKNYVVSSIGMDNYDTYAFFMVSNKLFEKVGKFDNHYQVYCEDVDMEHRINLSGEKHWVVKQAEFFHAENITFHGLAQIGEGDDLRETNNGALEHFKRKWGGVPRQQTYKHPFDNPEYNHTYIGNEITHN